MGGFVLLPPVALFTAGRGASADATADAVVAQMYTTHKSAVLERYARVYARLLHEVLNGGDLRAAVATAGRAVGMDVAALAAAYPVRPGDSSSGSRVIGGVYSPACYIEGSFPSLLYLAFVHAESPRDALVANTNVGGENCHRCEMAMRSAAEWEAQSRALSRLAGGQHWVR